MPTGPGTLCVYCGSRPGARPAYSEAATALGRGLAERGISLVYGGAGVGLMGTLADAALAAGGRVTGIIPRALMDRELAHARLTRLEVVDDMHMRKARMAALADGFIALPGGLGTLEELFEMLTWAQIGLHAKPCGVLDVARYYQPLVQLIEHMSAEGFIPERHRQLLHCEPDIPRLLTALTGTAAGTAAAMPRPLTAVSHPPWR